MSAVQIEVLGRAWLGWLVDTNLWTLATLVVVVFIDRLLAKRLSAGWRLSLYGLVFVRLVFPEGFRNPWALFPGPEPIANAALPSAAAATAVSSAPTLASASPSAAPQWGWGTAVLVIHAAGALLLLARFGRRLVRLGAARRQAEPSGLSEPGRSLVLEHPTVGPLAMGVVRRCIIVPRSVARLPQAQRAAIVRHERAHLRSHDPLVLGLAAIVCALAWPVAALWVGVHRMRVLMEIRADDAATAPMDRAQRRAYGEMLLDVASTGGFAPAIGLGEGHLRSRLRALGRRPKTSPLVQALAVGLAAATCITVVATRNPTPPEAAPAMVANRADATDNACARDVPWQRPDVEAAGEADAFMARGIEAFEAGDATRAQAELQEATWLAASIGYDFLAAAAVGQLVEVLVSEGRDHEAVEWSRHADVAFRKTGPIPGASRYLLALARMSDRNGDRTAAARFRSRASALVAGCR